MDNLKDIIIKTNLSFIQESKNSITLIEDMAAMEKYMTESYSGRVFIELIQNADDCNSKKIQLIQIENDIYFANDGKPFDGNDIISICRSGTSMKKRGKNIGYRGIGFKSTTSLSDEIYIYSSGITFAFSKTATSKQLDLDKDKVPTVRIPFLVTDLDPKMKYEFLSLYNQGYATIFVFKNANINKLKEELCELKSDIFIFLNHIEKCFIDIDQMKKDFVMKRKHTDWYTHYISTDQSWYIIQKDTTSLAFKENAGHIIPCNENEAVYHCFLPTLDKTPFLLKINANFSTDPSRKHILIDEVTNKSFEYVITMICDIISDVLNGKKTADSYLLSLLYGQKNFSLINQKMMNLLKKYISIIDVRLNNGSQKPVLKYKVLPKWLDSKEKELIRLNSRYLAPFSLPQKINETYFLIEEFMEYYSENECNNRDLLEILSEQNIIEQLSEETIANLLSKLIKWCILEEKLYGKKINLKSVLENVKGKGKTTKTALSTLDLLAQELSVTEIEYINTIYSNTIFKMSIESKSTNTNISHNNKYTTNPQSRKIERNIPIVERWRSAEQRVVQIEKFMGNTAKDVSIMNIGYDIESITPLGEKRYIEVKSLRNNLGEFSITNNEYTAAHQFKEKYYICLIFESKAIYIQDPLKKLNFSKRIRQWEWVCNQYSGVEINFESY